MNGGFNGTCDDGRGGWSWQRRDIHIGQLGECEIAKAQRLIFRHLDANGKQLHAFEKRLDGSFKVVS